MKFNYRAWDINPADFYQQKTAEEKLRFLINFAVLAPSSHNAQPWKFRVEENTISVMADSKRKLPVSDASERHTHISLGCAIENICVAADYCGFETRVEYFPAAHTDMVATISFRERASMHRTPDHLIFSISRRRSNRNSYTDQMPDKTLLDHFGNFTNDKIRVDIVMDQRRKDAIAELLVSFRERIFSDARFRGELADYKRTNLTRSPTGIPGFTMGFSMFKSLIAPFLIRYVNVVKLTRNADLDLLTNHTPVFVVLSTEGDTKEDWLETGRLFNRMLLEAEQMGVQTSISAVPFEPRELQQVLATSFRPQIFFRMGYANAIPLQSPRLSADSVIV